MTYWDFFCDRCGRPLRAHNHIGTLCASCGPKTVGNTGGLGDYTRGIRGASAVRSADKRRPRKLRQQHPGPDHHPSDHADRRG